MRILIVSDYSTRSGGAENYALRLRDGLRAEGHEVAFFSSDRHRLDCIPEAEYTFHPYGGYGRLAEVVTQAVSMRGYLALRHCIRSFRPDIVHLHLFAKEISAAGLAALRNVPTVGTVHDYAMFCPVFSRFVVDDLRICDKNWGPDCVRNGCVTRAGSYLHALRKWLIQKYASNIDLWIAPSRFTLELLKGHGMQNSVRLPYGIDLAKFNSFPWPRRKEVLFAGRLHVSKGVETLVEAWRTVIHAVPEAHLWIAGNGPQEDTIKTRAEELGISLSIDFLEWQSEEEMRDLHQRCSVQVVPSIWADNYPVVICEAFAMGTPVVGTRVGGIPDLVGAVSPELLVPPKDPKALAAAVVRILSDETKGAQLSRAARAFAEKHLAMRSHISAVIDLYNSTIS